MSHFVRRHTRRYALTQRHALSADRKMWSPHIRPAAILRRHATAVGSW